MQFVSQKASEQGIRNCNLGPVLQRITPLYFHW